MKNLLNEQIHMTDTHAFNEQINTCNGRHCGDTFTGPNKPNKPSLWTENWTAQLLFVLLNVSVTIMGKCCYLC